MLFALLVLFSAFLIEGIGTYVSVVGLSSLFSANPVIITLAVALDIGKIVTVSFLYKYWKNINWLMKSYMSVAALVLMIITSAGAFGFLSGEFQKAIADTSSQNVVMATLTDEQSRLQARKNEIDKQISQLKTDNVRGRTQLMRQFGPEVGRINKRLEEIDKELPKLKVESIKKNVEVGPIIYVAEAFHTTPEQAVKWVILIIIFVFDPLAVALLIAGNYLLELRKKDNDELSNAPLPVSTEAKTAEIAEVWEVTSPVKEDLTDDRDLNIDGRSVNTTSGKQTVDESLEIIKQELYTDEKEISLPMPDGSSEANTVSHTEDKEQISVVGDINDGEVTNEIPVLPTVDPATNIAALVTELEQTVSKLTDEPIKLSAAPIAPVLDVVGHDNPLDREVITLEQITKQPVHRSSLEDVDAAQGDIHVDDNDRERSMKNIFTVYRD